MQTRVFITMECPECDETIKKGMIIFHEENEVPEISWDTASCSSFECEKCEKGFHTGDFDYLTDDEI